MVHGSMMESALLEKLRANKKWNALHLAVVHDRTSRVLHLVTHAPHLATERSSKKETPLFLACQERIQLKTIELLLKGKGFSQSAVNLPNAALCVPLHEAAKASDEPDQYSLKLTQMLLDKGANPDVRNQKGDTPLHVAVKAKNLDVVEMLLLRCKRILIEITGDRKPPLVEAAAVGNLPILRVLLKFLSQSDATLVDARTLPGGCTALFAAAENGHLECVEELLMVGADPTLQDDNFKSPLAAAARNGHVAVVKLLLEQRSVREAAEETNNRLHNHPLAHAIYGNSLEVLQMILQSEYKATSLVFATPQLPPAGGQRIDPARLSAVSLLLNKRKMERRTEQMLDILLAAGLSVNYLKSEDMEPLTMTLLHCVENKNHPTVTRIVHKLLEHGADVDFFLMDNDKHDEQCSPDAFYQAVEMNCWFALEELLHYWSRPPLTLLAFRNIHFQLDNKNFSWLFDCFAKFGVVHGSWMTQLQREIDNRLQNSDLEELEANTFLRLVQELQSPSPLKQLCRFAVREACSKRAALKAGWTLPKEIKILKDIPNNLQPFLLMEEAK